MVQVSNSFFGYKFNPISCRVASGFRLGKLDSILITRGKYYVVKGFCGRSSHALYEEFELLLKGFWGRDVGLACCLPNPFIRGPAVV